MCQTERLIFNIFDNVIFILISAIFNLKRDIETKEGRRSLFFGGHAIVIFWRKLIVKRSLLITC